VTSRDSDRGVPSEPVDATDDPRRRRHERVVSITDDDLPDAVYIEGDLDARSSAGRRVIIDDDDANVVSASGRDLRHQMENRVRDRRAEIRRRIVNRRTARFGVIVVVALIVVGVLTLLGSSLFGIRRESVQVTGAVYTDPVALEAVIDQAVGTPVLLFDTDAARDQLEAIPWVDTALVRTDFPFGLRIDLREREPVLSYPGPDGLFRVLDAEGRVLDVIDGWPFEYLLLISGDSPNLPAGAYAPVGHVGAARLADVLTGTVRDRVAELRVDAAGTDLQVVLDDSTRIRFGAARDLFDKLVRLETVFTASSPPAGSVIDVSTDEVTVS